MMNVLSDPAFRSIARSRMREALTAYCIANTVSYELVDHTDGILDAVVQVMRSLDGYDVHHGNESYQKLQDAYEFADKRYRDLLESGVRCNSDLRRANLIINRLVGFEPGIGDR